MRETAADIAALQELLDRSYATGGDHVRSIFDEGHQMTARELVDALDGIFEMHLATLAGGGAPLSAPLDGIFFKGRIWFGLPARSVRARLVRRDPRVSASYTSGKSFAFIVHGTACEADKGTDDFAAYEALVRDLYVAAYGPGWIDWDEAQRRDRDPDVGFDGWIEPRVIFAKR